MFEFVLPDVGEGLTEAEIIEWRVAVGDTVEVNDVLVEIETAKSLVELPSPFAGTIVGLHAEPGATIAVGTVILTAAAEGEDAAPADEPVASAPEPAASADAVSADAASAAPAEDGASGANLVGYGTAPAVASRRGNRKRANDGGPAAAKPVGAAEERDRANAAEVTLRAERVQTPAAQSRPRIVRAATVPAASAFPVVAKPPVRKLARDLDVDLAQVQPTGLAGEVTRDDVIRHAEQARLFQNLETPDWGSVREEVHPVKGVRKAIAQNMVQSMFTAPHVTLFVDVDATRTMDYVKKLKESPDYAGVKVSPLLLVARAVMWAIRRNPTTNATWTDDEYTIKHYVNLGIAAATPRGLIVPNIKDAHRMGMRDLATSLEQLTLTAREGKTPPADQQGGTFTITNIGVFGMDAGTPVLMPGEVGILAFGTVRPKPWVVDGEVQVRRVTTLAASFDHRLVDGDVASRFLADVATIVEEPALLIH